MSSEPEPCEEVELSVEGEEIVCETYIIKSEVSEDDDDEDDTHSETFSLEGHRPVRPVERQKMRPWLIDLLDKNILPGLNWQNRKDNIFRISWKHAAHNCFNRNRDSDLFERWAVHTGRHHEGNHKRWKANFRCALNSLPDVMELKELGVRKGDNAFKVYKFLDSADPSMKEKNEIKKKYSLMAGIKFEESQSGSSTPTISTAPSSPDHDSSVAVDEGIQTLLKAIELKKLHQDRTKSTQKRTSTVSTPQTRSKRSKKESKNDNENQQPPPDGTVVYQIPVTISSGRPSPASTPVSDKSVVSTISPEEARHLRLPYVGSLDTKTGKITLVQLRKTDSPSAPTTPTSGTVGPEVPVSKMIVSLPGHVQNVTSASQSGVSPRMSQNILTGLRPGEQFITVPVPVGDNVQSESTSHEQKVTIPFNLLQQEFLQKSPHSSGLVNLGALLTGNSAVSLHVAKQLESMLTPTIPLPVLEQVNQAKLKEKRQKDTQDTEKSPASLVIQSDGEQRKMAATPPVTDNPSLPVPQLNKNITSIAAALRMSTTGSKLLEGVSGTSTVNQPNQSPLTTVSAPGPTSDPQGIRSKLVSRLMVSGSSMTSTAPNIRMPTGIQMAAPMATPRPRLDHLLVKPNPNLTLPRTRLQPVKQSDLVVMATATSSSMDLMSTGGPPKLIPGSEKTIDLNTSRSLASTTQTKKTKDADVMNIASNAPGVPSPVRTPELRPDILDKQVTIELGKMEKDIFMTKSPEDTQHFSDNSSSSKRTVQTQCNMFLWNYLNGNVEDSGKSDPILTPLPPQKKTIWTQCSFVENAALKNTSKEKTGSFELKSGEATAMTSERKTHIKQALDLLRSPLYKGLIYKVIKSGKKNKKALIITNRQYFGVLGHNLDPLTLTLTSNAKVTLHILFKPVEEFSLLNKDKTFRMDYFTEILEKIAHFSFCRGIRQKRGRRSDLTYFRYPFRRFQSENCLLWFKDEADSSVPKYPVTQCSYCKSKDREDHDRNPEKKKMVATDDKIIIKRIVPCEIVISEVVPNDKIVLKEMEKVVVEKIEMTDTVLECIPQISP